MWCNACTATKHWQSQDRVYYPTTMMMWLALLGGVVASIAAVLLLVLGVRGPPGSTLTLDAGPSMIYIYGLAVLGAFSKRRWPGRESFSDLQVCKLQNPRR